MKFEGDNVDGFKVTLRQYRGELSVPFAVDETIELTVIAKVSSVEMRVDNATGQLFRDHILKIKEVLT